MADSPPDQDSRTGSDPFWVELVGGPFDGQMAELTRTTIRFRDGTVRVSRGLWVPEAHGHYVEDGLADEALGIVSMRWRHDSPAVTPDFSERSDGQVDVVIGKHWPIFNEALADSVSSLPPRGQDVLGPSPYWIDVALAGLERAIGTGSEQPFASGNDTLLRLHGGQVEARHDYDDDEAGEFLDVDEFRMVLRQWRERVVASASSSVNPLPDTYRRNPMEPSDGGLA